MSKVAIIIDNRPSKELNDTIDSHMKFLPGWDLLNFNRYDIKNGEDYNKILTSYKFWANLKYDVALVFQHDSMLLKEIPESMLKYDYVGAPWFDGAPWARKDRAGGNGGLSLRSVNAHRMLLSHTHWNNRYGNEDVFFSNKLHNVAPFNVCSKFSVETEFKLGTVGYHAIDKHLTKDECEKIKNQYERGPKTKHLLKS
jgi:hypothetical protein